MSDDALLQWKVDRYEAALKRIANTNSGGWGTIAHEALYGTREQRVGGVFEPALAGAPQAPYNKAHAAVYALGAYQTMALEAEAAASIALDRDERAQTIACDPPSKE